MDYLSVWFVGFGRGFSVTDLLRLVLKDSWSRPHIQPVHELFSSFILHWLRIPCMHCIMFACTALYMLCRAAQIHFMLSCRKSSRLIVEHLYNCYAQSECSLILYHVWCLNSEVDIQFYGCSLQLLSCFLVYLSYSMRQHNSALIAIHCLNMVAGIFHLYVLRNCAPYPKIQKWLFKAVFESFRNILERCKKIRIKHFDHSICLQIKVC